MQARLTKTRAVTALGACGLLAAATVGLGGASAGAEEGADWVVQARAGAADLAISTTGGFIVDQIDPGGAVATGEVETATEQSSSLASAPYPSEIGEQGPGLLYGLLQNTLPYNGVPFPDLPVAPAWPWTVRASGNGTDPKSASLGDATSPFRLKSTAGAREAAAHADAGGAQPGALGLMHFEASSAIDAKQAGKAVVKAASTVENLMIGGALRVGEVHTELDLSRTAAGQPEVTVKRSITGLDIGGVAAELRPDGLFFQGTATPLPAALLDGLKSAGIELEVGTVEKLEGGVRAKGLIVRMPFDFSGMSNDQFPFSTPHTMTVEMSFGTVMGSITQVGIDRPLPSYTTAVAAGSEPSSAGGPAAAFSVATPAAPSPPAATQRGENSTVRRPAGLVRRPSAVTGSAAEPAEVTAAGEVPVTETYETAAAPVAFQPAAATAPVGIGGREARDEMGKIGWIAQAGAVALVVLLVAGRARRAVGTK